MIGNDVVDLELAARQSNWRRKGFLNKAFSSSEQELIHTSVNPDKKVWLLWSMKEAAYKAHQREHDLPRQLNWLAQKCEIAVLTLKTASGEVEIENHTYHTTSEITSDYILTSAEKNRGSGVKNAIFKASSSEVKEQLKKRVSEEFALEYREVQLIKDRFGMPFLTGNDSFFFNRFSLSGHGRFYAYSLSLINCETTVKHS
ncbi:4'-phosphopantetheinyl transferase superfamily protein [Salinimicrobium sp. 3283s]|uniref:4'-phosphopantetheinyl transferase family protein n=1 Tax=Salinimicrobium sp. 3283s TaxID=3114359 RepID=UPI0031EFB019